VYFLLDYGDFTDDTADSANSPYAIFAAAEGVLALTGAVSLVARRRKLVYRPLYDTAPLGDVPVQHITGYWPSAIF
jgi:hypothetical protein